MQDAKIHGSEVQSHGFFNIECIGLAVFYRIYYDSIEVIQAITNLNVPREKIAVMINRIA